MLVNKANNFFYLNKSLWVILQKATNSKQGYYCKSVMSYDKTITFHKFL